VVIFVVLAYGLSWWPWFARLANPDSAAMFAIGPSIAALVVVAGVYGRPGIRTLLRSTVHARIGRWWWSITIPLGVTAATAVITVLSGAAAPSGYDVGMAAMTLVTLPIMLITNGPLGEELGWRGYLLPRFLRRHSPSTATLMLIPFWIAFHLPMIVTSPDRFGLPWMLMIAGLAFTMTWLHLRSGGSVLLAIVFHAVVNVSTPAVVQLFGHGDRPLAIHVMAALWVLVGAAVVAGPLRRTGRTGTADRERAGTAPDDRNAR
jgi:membrane protease YdiL (CAAX protease family)